MSRAAQALALVAGLSQLSPACRTEFREHGAYPGHVIATATCGMVLVMLV